MKYIVLSFDDGFLDFKENVLPYLEKYNFKASINVIAGFSDKTINNNFKYLSVSDIQNLYNAGFEIANHSNSHLKNTNKKDFEIANVKIKSWLCCNEIGAVIPYSQKIDKNLHDYFLFNNYLYLTDYSHHTVKRTLFLFILRVFNKLFKSKIRDFCISSQYYLYKKKDIKNNDLPYFNRLPVGRNVMPKELIKFIKLMGKNNCLTIVFHSIVKTLDEKVEWSEGAWNVDEFDLLLKYLSSNKNIRVVTQKELIKIANGEN